MSSFAVSVRRNQFGTKNKSKLLRGTVKAIILDVSASCRMDLWSNPNLDTKGQKYLILHIQLRGYKSLDHRTKHHKSIPSDLVMHIYNKKHSHMSMSISQLISGAIFLGMRSCKYLSNPKGEAKQTRILRKGDIRFYIKRCKLAHNSGCIYIEGKFSPTFGAYKNGVKNATLSQWRTVEFLCPLQIWAGIILIV